MPLELLFTAERKDRKDRKVEIRVSGWKVFLFLLLTPVILPALLVYSAFKLRNGG